MNNNMPSADSPEPNPSSMTSVPSRRSAGLAITSVIATAPAVTPSRRSVNIRRAITQVQTTVTDQPSRLGSTPSR